MRRVPRRDKKRKNEREREREREDNKQTAAVNQFNAAVRVKKVLEEQKERNQNLRTCSR